MVRVRKGTLQKKPLTSARILLQQSATLLGDPVRRVQLGWQARAPGLPEPTQGQIGGGQGMGRPNEALSVGALPAQPTAPVALLVVAVANAQAYLLKAVVGQLQIKVSVLGPCAGYFLAMTPRVRTQGIVRASLGSSGPGRRHRCDVLQVSLAHQGGTPAGLRQNLLGSWADDPARQRAMARLADLIDGQAS